MNKSKTYKSKHSLKSLKSVKWNNKIDDLGASILKNTKPINIELLLNIQKNPQVDSRLFDYLHGMPKESISLNISFLALIYQNKEIYSMINSISKKEKINDNMIVSVLAPYFSEGEEVKGGNDEVGFVVTRKTYKFGTTLYFVIYLFALLFTSYVSYNQILLVQENLETNQAYALIKDVTSAAMVCDFDSIALSKEYESAFKMIEYAGVIDKSILTSIKKTLKLRKCLINPQKVVQKELFKRTAMSDNTQMMIQTNISPNELQKKDILEKSLALVPSSTVGLMVPTSTMTAYITDYNDAIYNSVHSKISADLKDVKDANGLIEYFSNMEHMSKDDFTAYFEQQEQTLLSDPNSVVPTMQDLKNIMGIFSDSTSVFKLFISGFAGMNIMDIIYTDFKKKMREINADLSMKKIAIDKYVGDVIDDTATLISFLISFKALLAWFIFVTMNFGTATYLLMKQLRTQKIKKSTGDQPTIQDSNRITKKRREIL